MRMVLYLATWKIIDLSFHPVELIILLAVSAASLYAWTEYRHKHESFPGWPNRLGRRERNTDVLSAWMNRHDNKQTKVPNKSPPTKKPHSPSNDFVPEGEWIVEETERPKKRARSPDRDDTHRKKDEGRRESRWFSDSNNWNTRESPPKDQNREWKAPFDDDYDSQSRTPLSNGNWGSAVAYYDNNGIQLGPPTGNVSDRARSWSPDTRHDNGHRGRSKVRRRRDSWHEAPCELDNNRDQNDQNWGASENKDEQSKSRENDTW